MKSTKNNQILSFLVLVMFINVLGYGIIIPLMYPYAQRFGFTPVSMSFLFASFSLAQFIATPIIGRWSDKFGRKPMLLGSLLGTALSLALMAVAPNALVLFAARILDGMTGGNISVAQAVITDISSQEERAKRFGLLGAVFGFGFLIGPAIGGFLSQFGMMVPFLVSSGVAFCGVLAGLFLLPETLKTKKQVSREPLINPGQLISALKHPVVGSLLLITLLGSMAQNAWILGFQSFTVDVLRLSSRDIGYIFTLIGLLGIVMQGFGVKFILQREKDNHKILKLSLLGGSLVMGSIFFVHSLMPFLGTIVLYSIVAAPAMPVLNALISQGTKEEDQGGMMGINQSYMSLGQILGPLLAGAVSGISISSIFVLAGVLLLLSFFRSQQLHKDRTLGKADI